MLFLELIHCHALGNYTIYFIQPAAVRRTFGRMIPRPTSVGYARVITALGVPKGRWAECQLISQIL
jgi:hypothetical protein